MYTHKKIGFIMGCEPQKKMEHTGSRPGNQTAAGALTEGWMYTAIKQQSQLLKYSPGKNSHSRD